MPELVEKMLEYIRREVIHRADAPIVESTRLISSGLIDSFALVDIIVKLEELTDTRLQVGKIQPKDLDTVELMFATAKRLGRNRNG
jgi:acyl carrier protein